MYPSLSLDQLCDSIMMAWFMTPEGEKDSDLVSEFWTGFIFEVSLIP